MSRRLVIFVACGSVVIAIAIYKLQTCPVTNFAADPWTEDEMPGPAVETSVDDTPFSALSAPKNLVPAKVELGALLFHDVRLSKDNTISCASCHDLNRGGADGRQFAIGVNGASGDVNSPTVFNSSLNFRQFWDGRANSLNDQIEGPVHNPIEMASDWPQIIEKLKADQNIVARFDKIYGNGLKEQNLKNAIIEFERSLVTLNSPFDRYLQGDSWALSGDQVRGFEKFKSYGCVSCHQGQNLGGNMFQNLGVSGDYFKDRGGYFKSDLGRFNVTGIETDKHMFRVPSLRNVALTSPYFHDGTVKTLKEAVQKMGKYQLGRELSDADTNDLVAFLKSLTGERPTTALNLNK